MTSKSPEQDVTLPSDAASTSNTADAGLAKPKRTRKLLASAESAPSEAVEVDVVVKPKRARKVLEVAALDATLDAAPPQTTLALEQPAAEQSADSKSTGTLRVRKPRKLLDAAASTAPIEGSQSALAPAPVVASEPSPSVQSSTEAGAAEQASNHADASDAPAPHAERVVDDQEGAQRNQRKAAGNDRSNNNRNNNQRDKPRGEPRDSARDNPRNAPRDQNAAPRKPRPVLPPVDTGALFSQVVSGEFDTESITPSQAQDLQAFQEFEVLQDDAQSEPNAPSLDAAQQSSAADAGEFSEAAEASEPGKRVLQAAEEAPKLQKLLAQIGVASRRDIEEMIAAGRISVNGAAAHVGQRILHSDLVRMDGKPLRLPVTAPKTRIMLYHKPTGEVCTTRDPDGRPTVFANLPQLRNSRWVSVGRLDINTEGLLVFATNGELANRLMHPRHEIEREYAVRILGEISEEVLQKLKTGVQLEDGVASFTSIESVGGEGVNRWYRVVIQEGRNREVRRMFEAVGSTVSRLIRVRYANLPLPTILKRGQWAELDRFGVDMLLERVGLATTQQQAQSPQAEASRVQHEEVRNKRRRRSADRGGSRERNRSQPAQGGDNAFNAQTDGGVPFNANNSDTGQYAGAPKPAPDYYDDDHQPGDVNGNTMSNNGYGNSRAGYAQLGELAGRNGGRPRHGGSGGGGGGQRNRNDGGGARQPDPLKTTFGYVQHNAARSGGGNNTGGGFGGNRNNQGNANNRNAQGGNRGRGGQGGGTGTGGQGGGQGGANNANRGGRGGRGGGTGGKGR